MIVILPKSDVSGPETCATDPCVANGKMQNKFPDYDKFSVYL